jgi:hypothetical protein
LLALSAGPARAALVDGTNISTGSSLFLAVWSSTMSYVRDLGVRFTDVTNATGGPNSATAPNAAWVSEDGFHRSFAGDSLFSNTFASLSGLHFTLFATDSSSAPNLATNPGGFASGFSAGPTLLNYITISNAGAFASSFMNGANTTGCSTSASCTQLSSDATHYAGGTAWGTNVAAQLPIGNNTAAADGTGSLPFWYISTDSRPGNNAVSPGLEFEFKNSQHIGMWSLAADGTVTYDLAPAPLPGTLWFLGSALLCLAGFRIRSGT